jgi:hypothetical protein
MQGNRFIDMNGNFIIPRHYDYTRERFPDDCPSGWPEFFWDNLPADRKLLKSLQKEQRRFLRELRDFGFQRYYNVDQNGNVYSINPNIKDEESDKFVISSILEQLKFTLSKIQMIERQLRNVNPSPKRKRKSKRKSKRRM